MAQRSLPQAGTGVGDSGPYTSDQWAEFFQTVFTSDQQATQGPIRRCLNELEVTEAALAVTTDTGAGFVYGHWLINDVALVINIALAAAGLERYDRVVMVQNNTAAAYNTNLALPAAYAAGIPRNSSRIAILQGTEAGAAVLPPLLTGPNYYMVELARYFVNDAAVGTVTDYRDYCIGVVTDNRREVFVQPFVGWNISDSIALDKDITTGAYIMENIKNSEAKGRFIVPPNYDPAGNLTVTAVTAGATGGVLNFYCATIVEYGQCDEAIDNHTETTGYSAVTINTAANTCFKSITLTAEEVGDILILELNRDATYIEDQGVLLYAAGWKVEYWVR